MISEGASRNGAQDEMVKYILFVYLINPPPPLQMFNVAVCDVRVKSDRP